MQSTPNEEQVPLKKNKKQSTTFTAVFTPVNNNNTNAMIPKKNKTHMSTRTMLQKVIEWHLFLRCEYFVLKVWISNSPDVIHVAVV